MARHSIVDKLEQELRVPLDRESQVLYILAEIRKLTEHEGRGHPYELLEFFCGWALHTTVSYAKNADKIRVLLGAFDFRENMELGEYLNSNFFNETMQLEALRKALRQFLTAHTLPLMIVDDEVTWTRFKYLYSGVVAEVPLIYSKNDLLPEEVEQITVSRMLDKDGGTSLVKWHVKLNSRVRYRCSWRYRHVTCNVGVVIV
jgi:hypothetical protein